MSTGYAEFLAAKTLVAQPTGLVNVPTVAGHLFDFQRGCVEFGLQAGSWGLFLDTGLGKTRCQLEWAAHAAGASNGKALILTPLAVARQIEREGLDCGYQVRVIRSQEDAREGINVCNYDRLHLLIPEEFGAVSLDEASILKNFVGRVSSSLITAFAGHRFRCAATATPAPNDHTELAQHASFLGVMNRDEMLVRWFINDSADTKSWRLKGHAVTPFFDWMSSWARMAEHPRDLGDDLAGFDLQPLQILRHTAEEPETPIMGGLFGGDVSATGIHDLKRQTVTARVKVTRSLVDAEPDEPWLIFCDTDYEQDALCDAFPDALDCRGSYSTEKNESMLWKFIQWNGFCDKFTEWEDGKRNTRTTESGASSPTLNTLSDTKNSNCEGPGHQKKTSNTCASIIAPTNIDGLNERRNSETYSTLSVESNTPPMSLSALKLGRSLSNGSKKIPKSDSRSGSLNIASHLLNTGNCLKGKAESVPFAGQPIEGLGLTIATPLGESEGSSATDAILASGSLKIIQPHLIGPRNTSQRRRILIGKPSQIGKGLNLQFCARMVFVGRGFSYENWYQAVRRCWRFGQTRRVQVHLVVAEGEDAIGRVIDRKADSHAHLRAEMKAAMRRAVGRASTRRVAYNPTHTGRLPTWL